MLQPLRPDFYQRSTIQVARRLLGCILQTKVAGSKVAGKIVEVEAYCGSKDPACHSYAGRTKRTEIMFHAGGHCYVYFIYGNHYCVNVVCEPANEPCAVLIRALEPISGVRTMQRRRAGRPIHELTNGPGKLCQALGIDHQFNGEFFPKSSRVKIFTGDEVNSKQIVATKRIGISRAKSKLWRFYIRDNEFVSNYR